MRTILIINSKGGAGKTTLATNLAAYFASQGKITVVKDYDPQGSSSQWLQQRPLTHPEIHGIQAFRQSMAATNVWQMRLPSNTDNLIIDTPAGVDTNKLSATIRSADKIIIPVMPSPIDIRASAMFIRDLVRQLPLATRHLKLGVVASRVAREGVAYYTLKRVFDNLEIPVIASLHESENYIQAAEHGVGLLEMQSPRTEKDKADWMPLLEWITGRSVTNKTPKNDSRPANFL
ncbi:MAG: AAA family ATPase [Gammaproteobacteria bacterium]|nr:AAA family ATPase [Gammaproteobacteria bacterium]MDH5730335.1 AAA family ATPase [Gammaproteobacteria bacterium]